MEKHEQQNGAGYEAPDGVSGDIIRQCERTLMCKLSETEQLQYGRQLGGMHKDIARLEDERKRVNADYKNRLAEKVAKAEQFADALRTGEELRSVTCDVWAKHETNTACEVRQDTGDLVKARDLDWSERQPELPDEADDSQADDTTETTEQ